MYINNIAIKIFTVLTYRLIVKKTFLSHAAKTYLLEWKVFKLPGYDTNEGKIGDRSITAFTVTMSHESLYLLYRRRLQTSHSPINCFTWLYHESYGLFLKKKSLVGLVAIMRNM